MSYDIFFDFSGSLNKMNNIKFDDISDLLLKNTPVHKYQLEKKKTIYRVNEKACGFYLLDSGMVGLYRITEKGKEHLIRVYGAGDYFGFRSLFSNQPYHLTTKTLQPSSVRHILVKGIEELYEHDPNLLTSLITSVCKELGEAESRLSNIAAFESKIRVLDSIVELFSRFHSYQWTSREIAEYSGTETQTVIRFCAKLKAQKLLDPTVRSIRPVSLHKLKLYRKELVTH